MRARRRHGDQVHPTGGHFVGPPFQDGGHVVQVHEPACLAGRLPHRSQELREGNRAPVLDPLLPGRRKLSGHVTCGEDNVHVREVEIPQRPADVRRPGDGEHLLGDDRGATPAPGFPDEALPCALDLRCAVVVVAHVAQVEVRPDVRGLVPAGVQHAVAAQLRAVVPEHFLQERGARLVPADVEEHYGPFGQPYPVGRHQLPQNNGAGRSLAAARVHMAAGAIPRRVRPTAGRPDWRAAQVQLGPDRGCVPACSCPWECNGSAI